jgi:O-antigen ligase
MKIIPIYLILFAFWTTNVLRFRVSEVRGLSPMNICFYLLLIVWGIKGLRKRQFFEPNNLNKPVILMICVALFSVLIKISIGEIPNLSLLQEILDVKNWANPFFIFFAIFNLIEDEKQCKRAILSLTLLVMVTTTPMLIESFGIIDFNIIREVQGGRSAGFGEANQYASFLVLVFPLFMSYFLFPKNALNKIFWAICCMIVIMGLVLTGSRGGILSFIISFLAYLWFIKPIKRIRMKSILGTAMLVVVLFVIAYLFAPISVRERANKRFNPKNYENIDHFSNARLPILRNGIVLFLESPIWGHGHDTFIPLVRKRGFKYQYNTHNTYLAYLIHYGLIGLFIYLAILTKIFQQMWRSIETTEDPEYKVLYASYLAGFLGYAFSMLGVNLFGVRIVFWFYTAIIYKYSQIGMDKRQYRIVRR